MIVPDLAVALLIDWHVGKSHTRHRSCSLNGLRVTHLWTDAALVLLAGKAAPKDGPALQCRATSQAGK
jgi:hypothetical protein